MAVGKYYYVWDRGNYPVYKRTESGDDELVSTEYTYQAAKNKVYELNGWKKKGETK